MDGYHSSALPFDQGHANPAIRIPPAKKVNVAFRLPTIENGLPTGKGIPRFSGRDPSCHAENQRRGQVKNRSSAH